MLIRFYRRFYKFGKGLWYKSQAYREPYKSIAVLNRLIARGGSGTVKLSGWQIDYIESMALKWMYLAQFSKTYNDFETDKEAPLIIDCGANIGISVFRFKTLYPNARIIAFEPDPDLCAVLRRNVAQNNLKDVTIIEAAVWSEKTQLKFVRSSPSDSQSGHILTDDEHAVSVSRVVEAIWLGDYLNETIDFLKVDIEGGEYQVLESCRHQLDNVSQMVVEVHHRLDRADLVGNILKLLYEQHFYVAINKGDYDINVVKPQPPSSTLHVDQWPIFFAWKSSVVLRYDR